MLNNMVFLFVGAILALGFYFIVWNATGNIWMAFAVMVVMLAFWIGTLSVVFNARIPSHR